MMKSKLLKIIAKFALALFVALAVSAAPRLPGTVQAAVDIPSLYAEIAGGYEFYLGQKYLGISVSLDRGKLWVRATSSGDPNLDFEILPRGGSAAVLTIRAFDYYQARDKFKGFIDDSFDRSRRSGVQNLILDLRGNSGGDPFCTTHLLCYLEPMPIPYFARVYPDGYERFAEPIPRAAASRSPMKAGRRSRIFIGTLIG